MEEVGRKDVELFGGSGLYLVYDGFVLFLFFASEAAAEAATQDKEPLLSMSLSLSLSLRLSIHLLYAAAIRVG